MYCMTITWGDRVVNSELNNLTSQVEICRLWWVWGGWVGDLRIVDRGSHGWSLRLHSLACWGGSWRGICRLSNDTHTSAYWWKVTLAAEGIKYAPQRQEVERRKPVWGLWNTWVDTEATEGTSVWPHVPGATYSGLSLGSTLIGFEQVTEAYSVSTF